MNQVEKLYFDAVVLGSGAAGYKAACTLKKEGVENIALVTEAVNNGTSRNGGSDKQTYYKLGLGGANLDSVRQMARDYMCGGAMDGDTALCEAALSARCFLALCELGVEFPCNRYGEYIGYRTDHDLYARATSAGPLTSKMITQALEKEAERLQIPVFDGYYGVEILKNGDGCCGLLCIYKETGTLTAFITGNLILATGGPGGIYEDSVYPLGHTGSSGLAIRAGVAMQNLTEWQYGMASVNPRWNVSGTYMQVLPRFISIDESGQEHEFLMDYFRDPYEALSMVFLKGYQWPFDCSKVQAGSSIIDLLVYRQSALLGRKVFLDYRSNPFGIRELDADKLSDACAEYLRNAGALFGTPIERLAKMNQPAIDLYSSKGVDLALEPQEIALCAQHHNGGIAVDAWWQTTLPGLFAVGECAGTHGICRPGGSALNSGQVGALRAAQFIAAHPRRAFEDDTTHTQIAETERICGVVMGQEQTVDALVCQARKHMSRCAAAFRDEKELTAWAAQLQEQINALLQNARVSSPQAIFRFFQYRDMLFCQRAVVLAMLDYAREVRFSRGSALYYDPKGYLLPSLEEIFRFSVQERAAADKVQQVSLDGKKPEIKWRTVRPMPTETNVFENVWRTYRENKNRE